MIKKIICCALSFVFLTSLVFITSNAEALDIVYSQDFESVTTPEQAGFSTTDSRSKGETTFKGTMAVENGKLKVTTQEDNSSLYWFEFLPASALTDYNQYTISYDVYSVNGGISPTGTDWAVGMTFAWDTATNGTYSCVQFAGSTFNLAFASGCNDGSWIRSKSTYRYDMSTKGITTGLYTTENPIIHTITNTINTDAKTMTYTVDGIVMEENVSFGNMYDSPISLLIYGKNVELYIDNIEVTATTVIEETTEATNTTEASVTTKAQVTTEAPIITTVSSTTGTYTSTNPDTAKTSTTTDSSCGSCKSSSFIIGITQAIITIGAICVFVFYGKKF